MFDSNIETFNNAKLLFSVTFSCWVDMIAGVCCFQLSIVMFFKIVYHPLVSDNTMLMPNSSSLPYDRLDIRMILDNLKNNRNRVKLSFGKKCEESEQ